MWFEQRKREKIVEGIVYDIIHDRSLRYEQRIKLERMGEEEIKRKVYKIFNTKVKSYPIYYSEELVNKVKVVFFETLEKER